jgi:hypothetical protein
MKGKTAVIILVVVILLIAGAVTYGVIRSGTVKKKVKIISDAIDSGMGVLGTDLDSVLANVKTDTAYHISKSDLQKLKDAKGPSYAPDHPEYISQVLTGKTKAQIKSILADFLSTYQIKLNDHLNMIFDDLTGYDSEGYQKVLNLVINAK